MKIFDITKNLFNLPVYPGDPEPKYSIVKDMKQGDEYNLTYVCLCPHNSTHVDAPKHFINNGETIESVSLEDYLGKCQVVIAEGEVDKERVQSLVSDGTKRLLLKGKATLTISGAHELVKRGVVLVGIESGSIGDTAIHRTLLKAQMAILENADLNLVEAGEYTLVALPLKWEGIEASPVRAILIAE
ncbi:cyclase family protein [Ohessyouella blattaphilus]|uniref:Cyclase family protein n=1 Tax=Ohessyouella blattaphilus TaxID=2949333 RepID=A0ABT1EE04_9FIRM|nr:cyclase family protein [Ohessyouella blattaphilus]MCP1108868.1 cyclase family protein [Ohessyouella blattaphilus]MCR8562262.1 cyclase family protein [Ohessyouella blattaphilus]MDL2249081.1 cyclase family protein [Lachnospiraceae bacterium OttesenSCG-928-J05]